ncbi:hypothetical protein FK220_014960 [Flavobacteriaceae bacterium TP-CH-4]|uniref:SdiA-regulated n=1 Tax=Pelagihabitans pacificus TaxID=2696054 RepID=A0A967AUT9_9FLAO|nr:hypothetical protein [Pelagihabitans pacificus]NHF60653.1 hypothetical protein [Pelagihabitans pacificus]
MKKYFLSLLVIGLLFSCTNYGQLTFVTKLPKKLDENSGILHLNDSTVWFIQDGGNSDELYQVGLDGSLLNELKVKNGKNVDWEDLAKDEKGNVYIGDFGNNDSDRKDLVIYKVPNPEIEKGDKIDAQKIKFRYPDQKKFPPKNKKEQFDAEALFYKKGYLFIITKNRTHPFTGKARIYKVPAKKGKYKAVYVGEFTTCMEEASCRVTAATISDDGKTIVLLGEGKLWIFSNFSGDDFSKGTMKTIDLKATSQLEAVCFLNEHTLLISDEERSNTGRNLYSFNLK